MTFIITIALLLLAGFAEAAPCTKGVNCYCDKVAPSGPLADTQLLLCEDFEAPTLYLDQGVGNGAPYYGPWYDASGQAGNLGVNSYWNRKYSNGVGAGLFKQGETSHGVTCSYSLCVGEKVWDAANRWGANALKPFLAILRNGEFGSEVASITPPTGSAGGGSGVFDGTASMAHRIGAGQSNGIIGAAFLRPDRTKFPTFGVTMAMAFPNNLFSSSPSGDGVLGANWKFNEWIYDVGQAGGDGLFLFGLAGTKNTTFPFYQFTFGTSRPGVVIDPALCTSRAAAATVTKGTVRCDNGGNFIWEASPSDYSRPTDWPLGTWGCVEAYYQNMGSASSSVQMWFTGPAGVRKQIVNFSNMNLTSHAANYNGAPGYVGLSWNNYANTNQGDGGVPTTQTTFRYEDNLHIRGGAPVACAQIGFAGGGVTPPPTTFQLTTSTTGGGTLTGAGTYPVGASVIVLATPDTGNILTAWGGACSGTAGCVVTMDSNKAVSATFAAAPVPIPVLPPAAPTGTTVSSPVPDALGVTYTVTWSPALGAVGYGYTAAFNDGTASQQGTIAASPLALRMPYHTSRLASNGFVCVRSVGSTGLLSADAACASVLVPAPPVVVPPPTGTLTVGQAVSRCRFWLTSTPPDTTGGWTVKYFQGTTPVMSPVELVLGTYVFTAQWSKVGQTVRTPPTVTKICP